MAVADYNPFAKRETFSRSNLTAYKVLTVLSWLLVVVTGAYYTFRAPTGCQHGRNNHNHDHNRHDRHVTGACHTIWGQNSNMATPFSLNALVTSIYWIVLLILQFNYVRFLWSTNDTYKNSAANVGSHFIANNLLTFGFIMLWVRGHFWPAELLLIVNMCNLTMLYFRHSTTPRFVHVPIVSAPLAWTYVAILWCGAAMVNASSLPARILANIAIWGILGLGSFYVLIFKDYTIGLELAILSLSLALAQMATHVIAFQWIFAFVIMGCLVFLSLLVGMPGIFGQDKAPATGIVSADQERQPLLNDE